MRILIVRLSALGDTVCSLPAAVALRRAFPEATIEWAVDPRFAGIVRCCSAIDRIHEVRPRLKKTEWPAFESEYDVALDLQGLTKSAVLVARARAKRKLGYHWQREFARFFTTPVVPDPSSFHVVDQYVDVARAAGGVMDRAEFDFAPLTTAKSSMRTKRGDIGPYVVLNAGAGWVTKRWPPAYFARLADRLRAEGLTPVFVGGPGTADRAAFGEVRAETKSDLVDLVGQTSVEELIALIAESRANVAGDTGTSHIAAALGVPAISLFSITRPQRCCPYGQVDRCHYHPAGLERIRPEEVAQSVLAAIAT